MSRRVVDESRVRGARAGAPPRAAGARARARTGAAVALAALLALTGCVGIPSSGPVQVGGLIDDQVTPDVEVLPDGPAPDSDPVTLLTDFMQAVQSPVNNYAIAKQFMTAEMAEQWDPNGQTTIRRGSFEIVQNSDGVLDYAFTSSAFVDERGRYFRTELNQQRLTYSFAQVDGQWRISAAPTGIVLTENSFDVVFRAQSLYFYDPAFNYLVPDLRWVPIRPTANERVVRLLLEGPADWLSSSVVTQFPEGTTLEAEGVVLNGTSATVYLSAEAAEAGEEELSRMRQQLSATLGVATVLLSVGGGVGTSGPAYGAIASPQVDGTVLIGTGAEFGYPGSSGIVPVGGLSDLIVSTGADAAVIFGQRLGAFRADGTVYGAVSTESEATPLDSRPGLVRPALDPYGFVWTAQGGSAGSLSVYALDGSGGVLPSPLPADSQVISLDVSRDGARLLLSMISGLGEPQLLVAGIIRGEGNLPVGLSNGLPLLIEGIPVDAAWVGSTQVAALVGAGATTELIRLEVGGHSASLGTVPNAVEVVGGNFGQDGIRVLADGLVHQLRGRNWQSTGLEALFLGVQQGRDR